MTASAKPQPPSSPPPSRSLPRLREDLELVDLKARRSGSPKRLIYDPLRHRYIRIDRCTFELMSILNDCNSLEMLKKKAWDLFSITLDQSALDRLLGFLEHSELIDHTHDGDWRSLAQRRARAKGKIFSRIIHNYLFFKIPIFRPQRFLERTLPFARRFMSRTAAFIVVMMGVAGLYLVSRQWDSFLTTFQHAFTLEGALTFALALAMVKALHELAHAYTAVGYGCRVASLGVAFILMTPLLYTDVTDAWRLKDNRKRLAIDAAGMILELSMAAIATFLWAFLPEGSLKSLAFAIATVGWIMSLALNLNPFMRFDGYYILSDFLNVENLQPRAFALARWSLRELLFDIKAPSPEVFPRKLHLILIAYAGATWIYRLLLFIGIALLVYTFFFKVLGIVLFAFEIMFFVAKPVWSELREWIKMRKQIMMRKRTYASLAGVSAFIALIVLPWSTRVEVPALLIADDVKQIYPSRPAKIIQVQKAQGDTIGKGEVLLKLQAPELKRQYDLTIVRTKEIEMRLARRMADDLDRNQSLVLKRELSSLKTKAAGLKKEQMELVIRSPMRGTIIELNPHLHEGRWISAKERIALIGSRKRWRLGGYIGEDDIARLSIGATGKFIPDNPLLPTREVTLTSILRAGTAVLAHPDLASIYGGPIATRKDEHGRLVPVSAQFLATLRTNSGGAQLKQTIRGIVHLTGKPESILANLWRQILNVLVRESGA